MSFTIALAGKGGTGKTTTAALVVRALRELGARDVLAVDADPNSTLHEALGVEVERSVGEITEELHAVRRGNARRDEQGCLARAEHPPLCRGETRSSTCSRWVARRASGCYCYANNLVRGCIDSLSRGYEYVVMDNEAGLEHLSRRTTRNVEALLIVSDPSVRGIRTAGRLDELANELEIDVGERYLVVNRAEDPLDPALQRAAEETGLTMLGDSPRRSPRSPNATWTATGLFDLPDASPALVAVRDMVRASRRRPRRPHAHSDSRHRRNEWQHASSTARRSRSASARTSR